MNNTVALNNFLFLLLKNKLTLGELEYFISSAINTPFELPENLIPYIEYLKKQLVFDEEESIYSSKIVHSFCNWNPDANELCNLEKEAIEKYSIKNESIKLNPEDIINELKQNGQITENKLDEIKLDLDIIKNGEK
jgi:hypothetical protein